MQIDPSIFKAYDIRGIVGKTLMTEVARYIGLSFGSAASELGEKSIVVGRDGRLSGPDLLGGLVEGLRAAGLDVIDVGMVARRWSISVPTSSWLAVAPPPASWSRAATIRLTTTVSRWCWAARPFMASRSRPCASASTRATSRRAAAATNSWTFASSTLTASSAT